MSTGAPLLLLLHQEQWVLMAGTCHHDCSRLTQEYVPNKSSCFEVYGFDVMLDNCLKPWLLEVNTSPALNTPSPLDRHVKFPLVADALNLVGVEPRDRGAAKSRPSSAMSAPERRRGATSNATSRPNSASSGQEKPKKGLISSRRWPSSRDFENVAEHNLPSVLLVRLTLAFLASLLEEAWSSR